MEYNTDYFIKKFEVIPEENWNMGAYENAAYPEKKCTFGHCGVTDKNQNRDNTESDTLIQLFLSIGSSVVRVNDGQDEDYQQPTPKQRILAALADIKNQETK